MYDMLYPVMSQTALFRGLSQVEAHEGAIHDDDNPGDQCSAGAAARPALAGSTLTVPDRSTRGGSRQLPCAGRGAVTQAMIGPVGAQMSVHCQCPGEHLGWLACPAAAVYPQAARGTAAPEAVRWFAETELGWVRDNETDTMVCETCAKTCRPDSLTAAVLEAVAQTRWPDGSRMVDLSDQVLAEELVPRIAAARERLIIGRPR